MSACTRDGPFVLGWPAGRRPSGSSKAMTPDLTTLDSCRRPPTAPQPLRPGFAPGRNHSGGTGRLRRFATALLIALAAAASGVPTFAQLPPLTAQFENGPASHNGLARFWVDIRFSDNVELSYLAFKDNGLLTITGGVLRNQRRLTGTRNVWQVEVKPLIQGQPLVTGGVTITLPAGVADVACDPLYTPCTQDGRKLSAPASITVPGPAPRVTGSTSFMAAENQTAVAALTATDANTPDASLTWSIPSGAAGGADAGKFTLSADGVLAFASAQDFENPDDADSNGIYAVTVEVSDGALTDTANLTVTLTNVNEAPTANAGPNQIFVQPGATVTLSGSGSDPDAGDTLSYAWARTGGELVTLTDANAATATFTAPAALTAATTLTFRLRVTDAGDLYHDDTMTVTGGQPPQPPVITGATSLTAAENQTAVAMLTATDADTSDANLTWSIPSGPAGGADAGKFTLSSSGTLAFASAKNFEIPDDAGTNGSYAVTVEVSDGALTDTADLTVTLTDANDAPTANAGADQTGIAPGAVVTLSGSGRDPDAGDTLSYAWTQTGSQVGTLTNANATTATFTAPAAVTEDTTLTFTLRVTDADGLFHEDSVSVTVTVVPPLTAQFENAPARHDGSTQFVVHLRFSENVLLNSPAFKGALLTITGGTVKNQGRLVSGSSIAWRINVAPDGDADVIITLPANRACDRDAAPCTPDGRRLSAPASVTVGGPNPAPVTVVLPLTAQFENAPARHDGSSEFTVHLRFSENVRLNSGAIRDHKLLTITGGMVTGQGRLMSGSSVGWRIDVTPNGDADVVITLPANRACDANAAPCTMDGRRLSAPASVRVEGPHPAPEVTGSTSFAAAENQTAVARLTATDDVTSAANLRWSIPSGAAGGADGGKFRLGPNTGVLAFASAKDFENPDDADMNGIYAVTVQVRDGGGLTDTADLTVTLTNVNEAPTADAGADRTGIAPGTAVTLSGSGSDPDAGDTLSYAWTQTGGAMGSLTNANAATATFTVSAGLTETTTFTFRLRVTDAEGLHRDDTVNVMVGGPVITSATSLTAAENQTAVATLTATDADTPDTNLTWSIPSGAAGGADGGRFTLSRAGVLAFASAKDFENPDDADTNGSYEVTVEVSDGALKATADLTVTLTDVNEAPAADAGSNQFGIGPGGTVSLIGSGSDPEDGQRVSFAWTQTGGVTVPLTDADTAQVTFTVPSDSPGSATFTFKLRVTDSTGLYSEDTAKVTVRPTIPGHSPQPPVITSAASLTVAENQTVVATLTATDADTPLADLAWSIPAGIAGGADGSRFTLSTAGDLAFASTKDFENPDNADRDGSYEVFVEVSDGDQAAIGYLTVTLTNVNEAPTADAGPNQFAVRPGQAVTLSGSGSDPDAGGTLSYAWTQTGSQVGTLTDDNTATATFTAPAAVTQATTLTFTLRVTDAASLYGEDTVTVTVVPQPPVITSATSFTVAENQTAVATLTATDADTPDADLAWSIPAGGAGGADAGRFTLSSAGVLEFASAQDLEIPDDADTNGIYAVTVAVSDGALTVAANLTVTLTNVNEAPTADARAGQTGIARGTTVTLSGSGSDPDAGDTLSYAWTQTGGESVTLANASAATATFTVPSDLSEMGILTFTLRVTDQGGLYGEDTVTLTVVSQPPVITSATSLTVAENQTAVATLTATDVDTPDANLTWTIPADAAGGADRGKFTLSSAGVLAFAAVKDFENPDDADTNGIYAVTVAVSDGALTDTANLTVTLTNANDAPTADAGADQTGIVPSAVVTLSGSGSDPDAGDTLSYAWTQTGSQVGTLTDANAATATFTAPSNLSQIDTLTFTLRVTDQGGLYGEDTVTLTVVSQPPVITSATSLTAAENQTVVAALTATDAVTPDADLAWSIPADAAGGADRGKFTLSSAGALAFASAQDFENPDDADTNGIYAVTVEVSDGALTDTADLTVTLTNVNEAPTADAGADQTGIVQGAVVTLSGSGSDPDAGDTLSYTWTSEELVTLMNSNAATATFTAPPAVTQATALTFTLRVTDAGDLFHEDTVTVTVNPPLTAQFENVPVNHDRFNSFSVDLRFSEDVVLNSSAFSNGLLTITNGTLRGQRQLTEGSNIAWRIDVAPPTERKDMIITLPANRACNPDAAPCTSDGRRLSAAAGVTVTSWLPPVLTSATTLTAAENQTAVATLTATDDETPPADLTWILQTPGAAGEGDEDEFTLSADGVLAFLYPQDFEYPEDANADGRYEVKIHIRDEDREVTTKSLTVTLTNVNEEPTADAGADQTNAVPDTVVTLSGSKSSDPDADDTLGYLWTQTGGPVVDLNDETTATATFTAPPAVTEATALTFTLRVTDAGDLFHEDTVTVTVKPQPPVITSAASLTVAENQTAVATLTATDADTPVADLTWSIPADAAGGADRDKFTLSSAGVLAFASAQDFENLDDADTDGIYAVTVEVSDGDLTDTADLTVTLTNVNEAPTADAGADQTDAVPGATVTLSGSGSDPDAGDTLSYLWTQIGATTVTRVTLTDANAATTTFTAPDALSETGPLTFTLRVTDAGGLFHEDTVTVRAAGTLALNVGTIAGDDTINIAEKAAGFTISGDTGSEAGASVTVAIGTGSLSATSADASGTAKWSVSVPADASYITGASVSVSVSAAKTGFTAPGNVQRTLTVDLTAPTAPTYTAPGSLKVGVAITAMSPSGGIGIDEYKATGLPPGLSIDTGTGAIDGTPDTAATATATATVTVSDTAGNTAEVSITFPAVAKGDQTLTGFAYSKSPITLLDTAPTHTAPTGAQTTLEYSAEPSSVCTVNSSTGALTIVGTGTCTITAKAPSNADYNEATDTFELTVNAAGALTLNVSAIATDNKINIEEKAAGFSIGGNTDSEAGVSVTVTVGSTTLTATSSTADPATWSVSVPANATYITGTSVSVTVSASKTGYTAPSAVQRMLTVDLTAPTAPTYTAPGSLKVGVAITAMSPSGGSGIDEYKATGLPPGLSIDTGTGAISGTPDTAATATATATVTVSDTAGNTAEVSISFPAVAKGDQTLTGFQYSASSVAFGSAAPTVTAPGGVETTLSYSATPSTVCTVNSSSGALTLAGVGDCVITATAAGTDDYNEATATFTVAVQAAGALVLNLDAVATDNTINIAEKTAGFSIGGNTGSEAGVSVTVTVAATELTATSADDNDPATWSVSVPADASYVTGTSVDVTVSATKTGFTAPGNVQRTLTVDLTAPTAPTYTAPGSLKVGVAITAMSPSGGSGIDEYNATGLPPGLSIAATTGVIDGTPDTAEANTASATVTASDTAGNTVEVSITFPAVAKGDQTLTGFQYSASSVAFGSTAPTVTAPGGVETTLSYSATPSTVCTVNSSSGALTLAGVGSCVITATAAGTDDYNEGTATFTVTVQAAGELALSLDTIATDDTVNIAEKTAGFTISGDTGTESGVDVTVQIGTETLTATSADNAGTATWSVSVPVDASYITGTSVDVQVNASKTGYTAPAAITRTLTVDLTAPTAPTYTAPGSLKVGVAITAMSPSGGSGIDEYKATGLPPGLSIDTGTGAISGTPDTADANTADATVTASDTAGNTAEVSITFPAVAKGDQTLTGFQYSASSVAFGSAAPTVTAPGGVETTLSYSATPSTVCTVNSSSGVLTLAGVGSCVITATAADNDNYNEGTATFTVTVQAAGELALSLDTIATDDTVNIAEKTAGFTISGDTGTESGVDVTVQIGTETLTATSADNAGTATWSVSVPVDASYITGTSVDVQVNASKTGYTAPAAITRTLTVDLTAPTVPTYTAPGSLKVGVAIAAMSPSGGSGIDEYKATGLPPGLSIDTGTGAISGTPDTADANTADATVTASDTAGNTAEVSITFPAVAKGDQTLTGFQYSASSVAFGSAAPTVTAPGGVETTLSYSATPSTVCTVNSSSGALTLAGVGDCVITATAAGTDDYDEATAMFTVAVQAAGALVLNLDTIAEDNTVNIAEKTAGFTISGDTASEAGVSVTVTVGTGSLSATSADASGTATWSVSVPADASYITGTSVDVQVNASKTGYTAPAAITRTLTVDLTAPTVPTYTAPGSLKVGVAITAMSPSGGSGIDEYKATGLPPGLSIDTGTGAISGTPDTADANTADATVTASDTAGNTAEVSITFPAVAKGDQTLTGFQYSASSVAFGSAAPTVTAPGGVETTLSYSATPSTVCTVNSSSGALTLAGVGDCVITATAAGTDDYDEATAMFTVAVQAAGALVLNLDTIAEDNTVNIAEKTAGFTISGDTASEAGVSVTVTVGTGSLSATSADASGTAKWSVSVPADASYITGTSVDVQVNASKTGYTAPAAITRTLTVDLTAPTVPTYTAPGSLKVGVAIAAMSPSGGSGIDEYKATGLPPGLSIDTGTGAISGTPDTADANTADATVTASDTAGNSAEVSITFPAVAKGDQTLTGFQYSASSVAFGSAAPTVTAPGGVETTLSYSATPSTVCTVNSSSGALTLAGVGDCVITATAAGTDDYDEATAMFTVAVQAAGALVLNLDTIAEDNTVNIAEKTAGFTISGDTASEAGVSVTVTVGTGSLSATSADASGTATWSVSVPADASYITGTSVDVQVNASKTGYTAPAAITRTLTVDLTAPTVPTYTAPGSLKVGVAIAAMSPSGGSGIDEYKATGLPPGLSIDTGTGAISGTPDTADANTADATVTASDTAGNTAEVSITFPAVAKGDQTLTGFQYSASSVAFGSAAPTVTAPGGVETTLSYSATPSTVCTVNSSSGALTLAGVGDCVITATAAGTDDYDEATAMFTVAVQAAGALVLNLDAVATDNTVNIAEKTAGFSIGGNTGSEAGVSITVTVAATELTATSADDNGTATWSVSVPADASYITGTSVDVTVSATKTGFTAPGNVQRTLTVDLTAPTAPTYTAPGSLKVGVAITAMSPSGGSGIDEYKATGLPPGLSIDTGTGAISGTPDTADANTADATVTASDTAGNSAEVSITFPAVAKGDQTLTGFQYSASSVAFGSAAPTVTAPGGVETTLSYSATPSTVCTVNSSSGALTLAGVGDCVITATAAGTDDYDEATAMFTVAVQAAGALVLNLDTIAEDNTVNIAEKTAGFTISGDTASEAGVSVTVAIGTGNLSATSADASGTATWSVSVPADASYITGTSVDVQVNASKTGYTAPAAITRTLTVDLTAPTVPTYTAPGSLKVGVAIAAMSPSGGSGIDEYKATGLPPGLSIDTGTGAISGTPDTADANTADATVTASDTAGNTAEVSITFPAVAKGDQTLTGFQYSASSVAFGSAAPTVTAPGGVETTLSYSATPSTVCTVNSSSGALTLAGVGDCVITATAAGTDDYDEATAMFTVAVQAAGALVLNLDTIATDNTVNIAEKTAGFTISGDTGTESGVDVTVTIGTGSLSATSADASGTAKWSVSVPANATYITGTSVSVTVSASKTGYTAPSDVTRTLGVDLTAPSARTYTVPASLKVGAAITAMNPSTTTDTDIDDYSATGLPPGLNINASTGAISGTPDTADANTADATVTVSDTAGNTAEVSITFPAVAKGEQTLTGFQYSASSVAFGSAAPTVTAPGGVETTLSYSATPSTVCSVDSTTGALTLAGVGDCVITATAAGTDDYDEATAMFTVAVQAAGALVLNLDAVATDNTINIAEKTAGFSIGGNTGSEAGVSITVTVGATELTATSADDNGTATWSVSVPADASYITGTSVDVTVSATKTGFTAPGDVQRTLTVDLTAPTAPTYTAPASLKVGVAITAMSPSGGSGIDEYKATGLPPGLSIDTGTGAISGTPDTADANTADATVTASDTAGNTAEVSITFPAVAKGEQTLTGFQYSASSVAFGSAAPTVTAPGGVETTLSYSATPSTVCTVNSSSGALTLAGVGSCVITATAAGTDDYTEATAMFTVAVQAAGALVLNLDAIATDNTVNIAEKTAGFSIGGNTGSEAGVSITVTVGATELTATSAEADPATWSVSVPANATYITGTSVSVTVSASKTGNTAPSDVTRTLGVDLTAPSARTYTVPTSLKVGVAITAINPSTTTDTDIGDYRATGLPSGLSIDASTGSISGTPDTANASTQAATVTISDTAGNTAEVSITFPAVAKGDQTLTGFAYSKSPITYGDDAPTLTAPTGAQTTLEYSAEPSSVCTVNSSTGALTIAGTGTCTITAAAVSTSNYNEATATFELIVQETMVPGAPTSFAAQASETQAALSWSEPGSTGTSPLTGYTLYRGDGGGCANLSALQSSIAPDTTAVEDTTVSSGNTYCYEVTASNTTGESGRSTSAVVTALTPDAPSAMTVTSHSDSAITLSWTAPADDGGGGLDGYNVYRCEEGTTACTPVWLAWVPLADGTSYTDNAVTANTEYRYAVGASRLNGRSDWSIEITATATNPTAPQTPTDFKAQGSETTVAASWTASTGTVASYTLYRGDGNACDNLSILQANLDSDTTYVEDDTVSADQTYCYRVSATNVRGESGRSPGVVVRTVTAGAPRSLTISSRGSTAIALRWTAPADDGGGPLDGYNVFRCVESGGTPCNPEYLDWVPVADGTTYRDASIASGRDYRYAVGSFRVEGLSDRSNEVTTAARNPTSRNAPSFVAGASIGDLVFSVGIAVGPLTLPRATGGDIDASLHQGELSDYSFDPADLPEGLNFDQFTRVLDGTPTTALEKTNYTYRVHDDDSDSTASDADTLPFTITIEEKASEPLDDSPMVWLFPRADDAVRQGFARVINHSGEGGEVNITAIDDAGMRYGPVALSITAGQTVHFNSDDLESGNPGKGLPDGVGAGQGDWRLKFESTLDLEVLSYIRTEDGFLTAMHDVAPTGPDGLRVVTFNPASNVNQVSRLRLINSGDEAAEVTIIGVDDAGASPGEGVRVSIPASESLTLAPDALESGSGLDGSLGDGTGKWRLTVIAGQKIVAMSLLENIGTGHLTNLSTLPEVPEDGVYSVPLFLSASDELGRQGFARVVNRSAAAGEVRIAAYDESDTAYEPLTLALEAGETAHFNSDDLELGNAEKGLTGSTGAGTGDWRLELTSDLEIEMCSYIRTEDGILTAMHDVAPFVEDVYRLVTLNPDSNVNQVSTLRLINAGTEPAAVTVQGIDDAGESPGGAVRLSVPAGAVRTYTAAELEAGDDDFEGALGDGAGKWRLHLESDEPLNAMSLLESPTGHLTNLSTAPDSQAVFVETGPIVEPENVMPGAPTILSAQGSETTTALTWVAPTGEVASYTVYRGIGAGCNNLAVLQSGLPTNVPYSTDFEDDEVASGTTYCYQVSASNDSGEGPRSSSAVVTTVTPGAPRGLRVTSASAAAVGLVWQPPPADGGGALDGYDLYRCEETDAGCPMAYRAWIPLGDGASFIDDDVNAGTTYRYAVAAVRLTGQSGWSNEATAIIPPDDPVDNTAPRFPENADIGDLALVVGEAIGPVTLPRAMGGNIDASLNRGELSDYRVDPAALPDGLTFDRFSRVLSGTPSEVVDKTAYTLWVHDDDGDHSVEDADSLAFSMTVEATGAPAEGGDPLTVWLFPRSSDLVRQGVARVINHSAAGGEVSIVAIDDEGMRYGPIILSVEAGETAQFNSEDLESGNAGKGLPDGVGPGQGDWRLMIESELDLEVLSYIRTVDGFLTAMHDVAPSGPDGLRVVTFNPASNINQVSRLRLINPGDEPADVTITGVDDAGSSPSEGVQVSVPASASVTLSSGSLETGAGVDGSLGDGHGKWRLAVHSGQEIVAMSLLENIGTGHLSNLSTLPEAPEDGVYSVPLFPSASDEVGRQGFARVANRSGNAGEVRIVAYDESDIAYEPLTLTLEAGQTAHFNSDDLELGNAEKGLMGSTGVGVGVWRLELTSDLELEVFSYIRTEDGFLTAMHDSAPLVDGVYRVVTLNPGSNVNQVSTLRLINAGAAPASVTVRGIDDAGKSPGGEIRLSTPAGAAREYTAVQLEAGDDGFEGSLGDGVGKWRLHVVSDVPLTVMSLLENPTGHLTNASTVPARR